MTENEIREQEESKRRMAELQIDGTATRYEGREYGLRRLLFAVKAYKHKPNSHNDNGE